MLGYVRRKIGLGLIAGALWSTALGAQAAPAGKGGPGSDVCSLSTEAEFQQARGIDPRIGIIPNDPVATQMSWGPHCDYSPGSIDLFAAESELEKVLTMTQALKQRDPVPGLGQRAFFTVVHPDDKYRRRGLLAVFTGSRIVTFTMDPPGDEAPTTTRPKLEGLAKLVLPRVK